MKIAVIGTAEWQSRRKIQDLMRRLKTMPDITVLGAGGTEGAGIMVKKIALDMGIPYAEYNPSFTGRNLYSAMPDSYYGKPYHFSQLIHRMRLLAQACDRAFVLGNVKDTQVAAAVSILKRTNKPWVNII